MPENKRYLIEIPGLETGSGIWDADKWERNKEAFMADYPEANVFELGDYDPDDTNENDQFMLTFEDDPDSSGVWDAAKWERNKEAFMADYPEAKVSRVRYVDYWGEQATANRERRKALEQPDAERNARLAEIGYYDDLSYGQREFNMDANIGYGLKPLSSAIETNSVSGKATYLDPRVQEFFVNDTAETERQAEIARLDAEYESNPSVIRQREYEQERRNYINSLKHEIDELSKGVDKIAAGKYRAGALNDMPMSPKNYEKGLKAYRKESALVFAKTMLQDAETLRSGLEYRGGKWASTKDAFNRVISSNSTWNSEEYQEGQQLLLQTFQKLQEHFGSLKEWEPEEMEKVLTPEEMQMVNAFFELSAAEAETAGKTSKGFNVGRGIAANLPFMLEFLTYMGVSKAIAGPMAQGLTKAAAKTLARKAGASLVKRAANTAARQLTRAGIGAAKAAVIGATQTLAQGTTQTQVRDAMLSFDDDGYLTDDAKTAAVAYFNKAIENFSEATGDILSGIIGAPLKGGLRALNKAFKTKAFTNIVSAITESVPNKILNAAGFHGFFEEMGEEVVGAVVRDLTISDGNLKHFFEKKNMLETALTFLPMTVLGGTFSLGQLGYAKASMSSAESRMRSRLADYISKDQLDYIISETQSTTPQHMAETMMPVIQAMAQMGAGKKEIEAVRDYMVSAARYQSLMGVQEAKNTEEKEAFKASLEKEVGKFYHAPQVTNKAGGTMELSPVVRTVTLKNGKTFYAVSQTNEAGEFLTIDVKTGEQGVAKESDVSEFLNKDGKMQKSSITESLNEFLTRQVMLKHRETEADRMRQQYNEQVAGLQELLKEKQGHINLGTEGAPYEVLVDSTNEQGVKCIVPDGSAIDLTWEQVGDALGQPIKLMTDQQIVDNEIADIARRAAERKAELARRKGTAESAEGAVTEAEKAQAKAEEDAKHIPMNPDGTVNETAFWEQDPEGYTQWNDEQNQDNGADSLRQIAASKQALLGLLSEAQKAAQTSVPADRKAAEREIARLQEKIARMEALEAKYAEEKVAPFRERAMKWKELTKAPVYIIETEDELKKLVKGIDEMTGESRVRGFAKDGKAYIYLPGIVDVAEIDAVFMHEAVAHVGLKGLLGETMFNELLGEVWEMMSPAARRVFMFYPGVNGNRIAAADEYIAHIAERIGTGVADETERTIWEKIVDFVRNILRAMGIEVGMNERELSDLLHMAYADLARNMAEAEKIAQQNAERKEAVGAAPTTARQMYDAYIQEGLTPEEVSQGVQNDFNAAKDAYDAKVAEKPTIKAGESTASFIERKKAYNEELGRLEQELKMQQALMDEIAKIQNTATEETAVAQEAEEVLEDNGIGVDGENGDARFSIRFTPTAEQREMILDSIMSVTGRTREEAERWLDSETSLAAMVGDEMQYLDYPVDSKYKAIKDNSDYPQGTVDFNNICRKRLPFTKMFTRLQRRFPNRVFTADELADIRGIMSQDGLTVACGLCYVEDRRQMVGEVANSFITEMQNGFADYASENATKRRNADKFLALIGEDTYVPSVYELTTQEGADRLYNEHRGIWEAFQAFNNARGQQSQNLLQGYAEYKREILSWSDKKVKSVNDNGGLRIFSYSDFEAHHLLDIVQIIIDCAAKGVKIQGYTKVPAFARAVANTGIKLNRSLIPLGDTGIVDGQLAFDPVEGIDINDPDFLESNDNVGNILIGINDVQIRMAMADPRIHFIIPYHARQKENIRRKLNVGEWVNYISTQNERNLSDGKRVKENINIYTDILTEDITTERQFVEKYLQLCREKGRIPKFDQFLNRDAEGNYVYTPGYYKFLVDFKLFDENGNILPQQPVVAEFDDAFNMQILEDYVRGEKESTGDQMNETYDKIVEAIGLDESAATGEDVRFSTIREVNDRFNAELQQQIDGTLPVGHVYQLGMPSRILRSTGIADAPIQLNSTRLEDKAKNFGHDFDLSEIKDLVNALQSPMGIFAYGDKSKAQNIVVEIQHKGKNFIVGLAIKPTVNGRVLDVNSIRNVFPKDNAEWLNWISQNKALYLDKEKIQGLIDQQRTNLADVEYLDLDSIAKIVENFENPSSEDARFSVITPQMDAEYLAAVERGDMETAQRMVDDAAKAAGYTIRGDHGRVSKFTIFDRNKANPEGNWGQGFYFSNNEEDVENNYATVDGPDLEAKIEREVEKRINQAEVNEDGEVDEFAIREAVENEFITSEPNVVHAAIKMDNPFVVGHGMVEIGEDGLGHYDMEETYLTVEYETDEEGEIDYDFEPTGTLVDLVKALNDELSAYEWVNVNADEILSNNIDGMTAGQFEQEARELLSPYIDSLVNDNTEIMSSEIIRAAIERAGFDGIVDNTINQKFGSARRSGRAMEGVDRDTRHYIAFQSNQIKQTDAVTYDDNGNVIPLSERFNPENPDIRFSIANENQAIFVSNAARAVEGIKMEKATPAQWLAMIEKAGGLKVGEDKWMGLSDWLKASKAKTLTKAEVLEFINENMIVIEEQHYGNREKAFDDKYPNWRKAFSIQKSSSDEGIYTSVWNIPTAVSLYNQYHEDKIDVDEYGGITREEYEKIKQFADEIAVEYFGTDGVRQIQNTRLTYTTEGLENLHEIALIIPTIESWGETDYTHFGDAGEGRAVAWIRFGDTTTGLESDGMRRRSRQLADELERKYGSMWNSDEIYEQMSVEDKAKRDEAERLWDEYRAASSRKKVLVIDEIQSKRHQEGREKGYTTKEDVAQRKAAIARAKKATNDLYDYIGELVAKYPGTEYSLERVRENSGRFTEEENNKLTQLIMEHNYAELELEKHRGEGIPDAPFDKNWYELAMKRMLRYAAENGYDVIAWTKGDQQAERYNIGSYVSSIEAQEEYDGNRDFGFYMGESDEALTVTVDENGTVVSAEGHLSQAVGRPLADLVGKEMAVKMMQMEEYDVLEDTDLKVGNEGMKGFYDKMLPAFMNKYGKKWGVKVEDIELPNLENGLTMHSVPVTEEMKASVMEGQVMFSAVQITPEVREEMDVIKATALVDGKLGLAPNGKKSKLTEDQWALVRTRRFKEYFGDWENDPENASKVIDPETGEPMVVYHGTPNEFTVFGEDTSSKQAHTYEDTFYFMDNEEVAASYGELMPCFVNLRNPLIVDFEGGSWRGEKTEIAVQYDRTGATLQGGFKSIEEAEAWREQFLADNPAYAADADYVRAKESAVVAMGTSSDEYTQQAKEEGYDGCIFRNISDAASLEYVEALVTDVVAFAPEQVKSAVENTGEYSPENPDIRFSVMTPHKSSIDELTDIFHVMNQDQALVPLFDKVAARCREFNLEIEFLDKDEYKKQVGHSEDYGSVSGRKIRFNVDTMNPADKQENAATILHEMIHACTNHILFADEWMLTEEDLQAREELDTIFKEVKKRYPSEYGASARHELLAELSNPSFRAKLKESNLWDRFVNALRRLFGMEAKTDLLARTEDVLDVFLDNPDIFLADIMEPISNENYEGQTAMDFLEQPVKGYRSIEESGLRYSARPVGGNRGYMGYSMSKRAAAARNEGRFPKTDFRKEYGVTEKTLTALVKEGIVNNGEWHHTSMYGNKTHFYGWTEEYYAEVYADRKKDIDKLAREGKAAEIAKIFEEHPIAKRAQREQKREFDIRNARYARESAERKAKAEFLSPAEEEKRKKFKSALAADERVSGNWFNASNGVRIRMDVENILYPEGATRAEKNALREEARKELDNLRSSIEQSIPLEYDEASYNAAMAAAEQEYQQEMRRIAEEYADLSEEGTRFSAVTDPMLVAQFESEPKIKVYRAMQLIDGRLYPPMSAYVDGVLREPSELGQWEQAEENTIGRNKKDPSKVDLEQGKGDDGKKRKTSGVLYNPYFHTSLTPLNDQFSGAQTRSNLVIVETEVPQSELTSGYQAEGAANSVGMVDWHSGPIAGVLAQYEGKGRQVILSRWAKPIRIVPESEIADIAMKLFEGTTLMDVPLPSNVFTPALREELERRGMKFVETTNNGRLVSDRRRTWSKTYGKNGLAKRPTEDIRFSIAERPVDDVIEDGLMLSIEDFARLAGDIFSVLPESVRNKVMEEAFRNGFDMQSAIFQIPARLAEKRGWDEADKELARAIRDKVQDAVDASGVATERPLTSKEAMWMLYNATQPVAYGDLIGEAGKALAAHNLGFDPKSEALKEKTDEMMRYSVVRGRAIDAATDMYNYEANLWINRLAESWLDMHQSVIALQNALADASGKPIESWEDIVLALNQLSSKSYADKKKYMRDFLKPLWDTIMDMVRYDNVSIEEIERYMMLKHGLERNDVFAKRDAREYYHDFYKKVADRMKTMSHAQLVVAISETKKTIQEINDEMASASSSKKASLKERLAKAQIDLDIMEKALRGDEKLNEQELQAKMDAIDAGLDAKYLEFREKDYGGLTGLFFDYDEDAVGKRSKYRTEEAYQSAVRAATKPKFDNVSDMEDAARDEVEEFEDRHSTDLLWQRINAATKETLRHQHASGMITTEQYDAVRDMFEYYVPLRGFADNTAEDMYSYYMSNSAGGFAKPLIAAKGRKTRAESPLGWIGTMAESAIQQDNKNDVKMRLYYALLNRPDNGLLSMSETWYEYSHKDPVTGKKVFVPAFPPATGGVLSADDMRAHMDAWEAGMKAKQAAGQAYKASQKIDLKGSVIFQDVKEEKEHIIQVRVAGKEYSIIVNGNPRAAQAINGLLNPDAKHDPFRDAIGWVRRGMSSLMTSLSPLFWVSNYQRDILSSTMRTSLEYGWKEAWNYFNNRRNAWRVASYINKYEEGTLGDSYYENLYKEFAENGGITGYTVLATNKEYKKMLENYAKHVDQKVLNFIRNIWDKFMGFGEAIEQVSRFAAYITARESGKSIEESVSAAKEVSVNFNRKGSASPISWDEAGKLRKKNGKPLNMAEKIFAVILSAMPRWMKRMYFFFNASVQATSSTFQKAKKSPGKAAAWAAFIFGTSLAVALINNMLADDDDEEYLDLPDYLRQSNIFIPVGDGYYIKWSIPQEVRPFYSMADILVSKIKGKTPHKNAWQVGKEMGLTIMQWLPMNPFDAEDPILAFVPDWIAPEVEAWINKTAFGGKIYDDMIFKPEAVRENIPAYRKATSKTGKVYVEMSELLNAISGGDEVQKGAININPAVVEHLVEGHLAGMYDLAKMVVSLPMSILRGEDVELRDIPFVNKVVMSADETNMHSRVNEAFYFYQDIATNAKRVEKEYRDLGMSEKAASYRMTDDWRIHMLFNQYEPDLKEYKDKLKDVTDEGEKDLLLDGQNVIREQLINDIASGKGPDPVTEIRLGIKSMEEEVKRTTKPYKDADKRVKAARERKDYKAKAKAQKERDSIKRTDEYKSAKIREKKVKELKKRLDGLGSVSSPTQRDSVIGEIERDYEALIGKIMRSSSE